MLRRLEETSVDGRFHRRTTRRQFVQGVGTASLALLAGCGRLPDQAQAPAKVARIGWLQAGAVARDSGSLESLQQALRELGYVEGQNLVVESRAGEGQVARTDEYAAELVGLPVDVILTSGSSTAEAARAATSTIPIVMVYPGDPVASGRVASLARPGGNVTGVTELQAQLFAKRLELLKETVPSISRVLVPRNPDLPFAPMGPGGSLPAAAQTLGVQLLEMDLRVPGDLDAGLEAAIQAGADAVLWGGAVGGGRSPEYRSRFLALAAQYRLPAICGFLEWAQAGVLIAYGPNYPAQFRRAAAYIDRILKGTRPSDLPVEQAREFDLVLNLQTARTLGLTIPPHVLAQATEVLP
jgi:putative ABC transport system substrate-binding protein